MLRCGRPVTNVEFVSILGYLTDQNDGKIGHRPQFELHNNYPIVLFTQLPNGWATWPWHTARSKLSSCQNMKAVYVVTKGHPGGVLVQQPDRAQADSGDPRHADRRVSGLTLA